MGSVYAGLLADAGNEVWVVDTWEAHVAAIREHGLRVGGRERRADGAGRRHDEPGRGRGGRPDRHRDEGDGRPRGGPCRASTRRQQATVVLPIQNGLGSAEASLPCSARVERPGDRRRGGRLRRLRQRAGSTSTTRGWSSCASASAVGPRPRDSSASRRCGVRPASACRPYDDADVSSGRSSSATCASARRALSSTGRSAR